MGSEHPEQSWEEPPGSMDTDPTKVLEAHLWHILHGHLWLSLLPKPTPAHWKVNVLSVAPLVLGSPRGEGRQLCSPSVPVWYLNQNLNGQPHHPHHPQGLWRLRSSRVPALLPAKL